VNLGGGGSGRASGVAAGVFLGLSPLCLRPVLALIPAGAPLGLVFLVSANAFVWGAMELVTKTRGFDFLIGVLVTIIAVWKDLAVAVFAGVVLSGLGFAWHVATEVRVESVETSPCQRTFYLHGPLFFGSEVKYRAGINPARIREEVVILDFTKSRILDISGIDAIEKTRAQLKGAGKRVILRGVPPDALKHLPQGHGDV